MTGFAVFIGLCCVFASNLYGFPVTFSSVLQFVFFGLILSIGAAGVKGAGVVMSGVLLEALGMPLTLIPILAAIWPVIDPAHTTLNNVGDLVGTTVVARSLAAWIWTCTTTQNKIHGSLPQHRKINKRYSAAAE